MAKSKEEMRVYRRMYYETHREQVKECVKKWAKEHPDELKKSYTEWCLAHSEQIKATKKSWYLKHKEKRKTQVRQYLESPRGKVAIKKFHATSRQLGFTPLNKYFDGAIGHHIDKEKVIYIPQELHRSIRHSLLRNRNMEAINKVAFSFIN
jgi:hypothetical protein